MKNRYYALSVLTITLQLHLCAARLCDGGTAPYSRKCTLYHSNGTGCVYLALCNLSERNQSRPYGVPFRIGACHESVRIAYGD